jgi:hypothetical protein
MQDNEVLRIEMCRQTEDIAQRLGKHLLCMTAQYRLSCNTFGKYRELFPRR